MQGNFNASNFILIAANTRINMLVEIVAFIVVLILLSIYFNKRPAGMPPGPTPLPIIGNMLQVTSWMSDNQLHIELAKAVQQYGHIFTFAIPGERNVVVNSAEIAREALLTRKDDFAGRPYNFTWDYLTRGSKDIAIGDFGPILLLQRKLVHSALRKYNPLLEETLIRESDKLCDRLTSYGGEPRDLEHDIFLTTLNIICAIVYGECYEINDPEFLRIVDYNKKMFRLLAAVNVLNLFPFMIHFPIKDSIDIENVRIIRDNLLESKLHEHQATYKEGVIRDLTDALIKALQEEQSENNDFKRIASDDYITMTMADAFSGGLETTMTTIRWFILYMMRNPDVQKKIHQELDDIIGRDVMPRLDDRDRLPYLQAAIAECARAASVVPLTIPHKACVDSTLAGYKIPKGTNLLINIWAMHHDEKFWKHPHTFDPTRFLDDNGKFTGGARDMSYLPFGAGRRVCIGEALAKQELFLIIARLMHRFRFQTADGYPVPEASGDLGLVYVPKNYMASAKER